MAVRRQGDALNVIPQHAFIDQSGLSACDVAYRVEILRRFRSFEL